MDFEDAYDQFIKSHCSKRSGYSLERLKARHGYAEKLFLKNVWWPTFHHFDNLHPEYEIIDFKDGYRYIDYAYVHENFRIAIEIDGLGPHWRDITKSKFCEQWQRQNHLVIDGWHVIRFGYDDVDEQPRLCQQVIAQLMGRLLGDVGAGLRAMDVMEREILLFAIRSTSPITPKQVGDLLHVSPDSAIRYMRKLCSSSWLEPASGSSRIRSYQVHSSRRHIQL